MVMTSPRTGTSLPPFGATCLALLLCLSVASRVAADRPCTCPFGGGSWLLFEDSNRRPPVPDFWDLEEVPVDELSVCDHGVGFYFTSHQDENLQVTALFFPKPTPELVRTRLRLAEGSSKFTKKLEHLRQRYATLVERVETQFAALMNEYGQVVLRSLEMERPRILDPRHSLTFTWEGGSFELRGYMDVYFTPMI